MRLLCLILLTNPLLLTAQDLYNNGALISIQENTLFSAGSGFTNYGEITNQGSLLISGEWMNSGVYHPSSGDLTLSGTSEQVVNHNNQSFSRLSVNGGSIKTFEADITITDELILNEGILRSTGGARIILQENAVVTGGSDDAYVEGEVIARGTGSKYFPLGMDGVYLPVELVDISGDGPEIGFTVADPDTNWTVDESIREISPNQVWQMEIHTGSLNRSLLQLPVREETFITDINQAVVVQSSDLTSPFFSLGQSSFEGTITDGTIISAQEINGMYFTIGELTNIGNDPDIEVFNAISPNNDGIQDFLRIENISAYPNNHITIYNRWGDRVYEASGYNNGEVAFRGISNINGQEELLDGTYFYVIDKNNGDRTQSGYIEMRR